MTVRREGDYYPLVRVAAQNGVDWANQIAVCRDHDGGIKGVPHHVVKQCYGYVHVWADEAQCAVPQVYGRRMDS